MSTPKNDDVKITFGTAPSTPGVEGKSIVQYDNQGQFMEAHSYGNFVEKIEGGVRVFRPDGVTISIVDGDITMEHLIPKSVGIRDISEVESLTVLLRVAISRSCIHKRATLWNSPAKMLARHSAKTTIL